MVKLEIVPRADGITYVRYFPYSCGALTEYLYDMKKSVWDSLGSCDEDRAQYCLDNDDCDLEEIGVEYVKIRQ